MRADKKETEWYLSVSAAAEMLGCHFREGYALVEERLPGCILMPHRDTMVWQSTGGPALTFNPDHNSLFLAGYPWYQLDCCPFSIGLSLFKFVRYESPNILR